MPPRARHLGFTLLELVVVLAILVAISAVVIPRAASAARISRYNATVAGFMTIEKGFWLYWGDNQSLPPDAINNAFPVGMDDYLDRVAWVRKPPMGDFWDWDAPPNHSGDNIGISIRGSGLNTERGAFDTAVDDGLTGKGEYRSTSTRIWRVWRD